MADTSDTSSGKFDKPRPVAAGNLAFLAARVSFKPGHAGLAKCKGTVRSTGKPCQRLAAYGTGYCACHGRPAIARAKAGIKPRCAVWTARKPRHQCEYPAAPGQDVCARHAAHAAKGHGLTFTPKASRVKRTMGNVASQAVPSRDVRAAHAAPRELRATQAWRDAGQRKGARALRATLAEAWAVRDTEPALWRAALRQVGADL